MRLGWLLLTVAGCRLPPVDSEPLVEVTLTTPEITASQLLCDETLERWQLDVSASSWTGGGALWWTTDQIYIESHDVRSRSAAPDGSSDELRLRLNIVADWRDAQTNLSTAFLCASEPDGLFVLYDPSGDIVACQSLGPAVMDWSRVADVPMCP